MTIKTIDQYLDQLQKELSGSDRAVLQDALADAEEHLWIALENELAAHPDIPEEVAIQSILADYGAPSEIADAYRKVETYTSPTLDSSKKISKGNIFARFFGIYADVSAWGALLYMFVAFLTGVIYFTWAVTGLSLALAFALFIFGLPFAAFFAISIKGLALLEGRIVEALLGVRMPRRAVFLPPSLTWRERLKAHLVDKYTWLGLLFMILQGVLGTVYFTLFISLIAFSLGFIAIPVIQLGFNLPIGMINGVGYYLPEIALPFTVLFGFLLLTASLHLAKWIGWLHGRFAKLLLVSD